MSKRPTPSTAASRDPLAGWSRSERPDSFSTYVPRDLVRRVKLIAALMDVPLWTLVTEALAAYVERFESRHGRLPSLDSTPSPDTPAR